jgi:hypothetical protein
MKTGPSEMGARVIFLGLGMSKFSDKIISSPDYGTVVLSIAGLPAKMKELHSWALEQREAGIHMGIFFTGNTLSVHTPKDHFVANSPNF